MRDPSIPSYSTHAVLGAPYVRFWNVLLMDLRATQGGGVRTGGCNTFREGRFVLLFIFLKPDNNTAQG
jgi:hypothetical protein